MGHPLRWALGTLKTIAACHLVFTYGYSVGPTSGPSMLPTIETWGDYVLVSRRHRLGRNVQVGDLVVYTVPIHPGADAVKRVIGMPGDYVLMNSPDSGSDAMLKVPEGHCWLVGDNLPASRDSRIFGPVPLGLVKGKVIAKTCTMFGWERIKNPLHPVISDDSEQ